MITIEFTLEEEISEYKLVSHLMFCNQPVMNPRIRSFLTPSNKFIFSAPPPALGLLDYLR